MNNDRYVVRGFVRFADGHPARGVKVSAFDRDLRTEEPLGHAETARDGSYRIEYTEGRFEKRERGTADLVVKAFDAQGALLVASPIMFNAPALAAIDLAVPRSRCAPPALFDKISSATMPLLGQVQIGDLEEDAQHQDLTFLAGETGFERAALARFALSHRLAQPGLRAEIWFALLGGSFFEYREAQSLAQNQETATAALDALDAAAARKAILGSIARGDVREALRGEMDAVIEAFLRHRVRAALGDERAPTFLGQALAHAGIEGAAKREKLARLFEQHRALTPDLLATLKKNPEYTEREIADLQTSYRLADLTDGNFSVVAMLKDEFDVRRPEQLPKLAKMGEREWGDLIRRKREAGAIAIPISLGSDQHAATPQPPSDEAHAQFSGGQERALKNGGGEGLRHAATPQPPLDESYARTLERRFRDAFPTAAFGGGLGRALKNGGAEGLRHAATLDRFLDAHADFDLLRTPIEAFLSNGIRPELRGAVADAAFRSELKAVQRVFKLAPTFAATDAMLADGVHSAQMAYRMGESEFVRRYTARAGLSEAEARTTWGRAAATHAAVLTLVADLKSLDPETLPAVIQSDPEALSQFPHYDSLFQAGDVCSCQGCRSVLSPAAYFADVLVFLKDRKAKNPAFTVKDILFARRPDLGYLELDCDNALTTLPYIDVVCEVLESVIAAGESDVELAGFSAVPADPAAAKTAVANALSAAQIEVGADFMLNQIDPVDPSRWVVHGDDATYLLLKKAGPNFMARLLPNTKASSEELRAYPAYVDAKAYEKLRQARHPFGLPFDLFGAEIRAGFEKCALDRWDLMRTLRGAAAPNNPTDGDIAAEYFGISSDAAAAFDEKRLILVADATTAGQQAVWGETGNPQWLAKVANVKVFLAKTGLTYEELLGLLDLEFVNPAGGVFIHHQDSSCDTDKKDLRGLNEGKLDVIHRFLRMWRKLDGWKMWELDLVLRHPSIGAGALDEPSLVKLQALGRLRARLGEQASIEQLAGLFGHLSTQTHFAGAYERRTEGLYQSLFLNRKLVQPLDHAFDVAAVDVAGPTVEKISGHRAVILAALVLREADLDTLTGLSRASNGKKYLTDDLTLSNLSFLWRHARLAKLLSLKTDEHRTVLKLVGQDFATFVDPQTALGLVETVDQIKASGFSVDQLDWILTANRAAKSAVGEADGGRFLTGLRAALRAIRTEYDPAHYEILSPPRDIDGLTALLSSLLALLHRDEAAAQLFLDALRDEIALEASVAGLPAGFDFPNAIKAASRVRYDEAGAKLRFTGVMTAAERTKLLTDPTLAAVTGIASYQDAVQEIFQRPRLLLKLLDPVFTAPLKSLPAAVDFGTLADKAFAQRVSYDADERVLRVVGVLTPSEKAALDALSAAADYRNAVNSVYTQPILGVFPPEQIWLEDADLLFPLRDPKDPATDHLKDNLAEAVTKALVYLRTTLSEGVVVSQVAAQLGLPEGLARRLLTKYAVLPGTLLDHLTGPFASTSGAVDYATLKATFDAWFWANRVAALWKAWKLSLVEWERMRAITAGARLLDVATLPQDAAAAAASLDRLLRTSRLFRFRDTLPETGTTLLAVLEKLAGGEYASAHDFALNAALLNEAWSAADIEALTASLDLAYPNDYLLAESWERLRRTFYFTESLNAGVGTVKPFAAAAMTEVHAKALKSLLRSKLGAETWLTLSAEIQDALRERKRDALSAHLLTSPQPADVPTGKWENTNDLYAYYLLDVEMCSCQLTSRLVQASGSAQLFVQRCFMGLEPQVVVKADGADGDSAWRWWSWMRKYRVWEANRKVFLWPENWIEPELKKDRSSFMKDLENQLLQNDVNQDTVTDAFAAYLEKLDGVAQLEVAGFYQEDDGDNTIVHVFGRTRGAEPHLYYYRRYDYRQWTPWEKVDLDIQGDYLVPAVIGRRLFLFWPIFMEVQDEDGNSHVPTPDIAQSSVPVQAASKKLRLQMAVSDYRQGKWTPKRVSKNYVDSSPYKVEIVRKHYVFYPIDQSEIDGRFGVKFGGYSADLKGGRVAGMSGAFEVSGCKGVPELANFEGSFQSALRPDYASTGRWPTFLKWRELEVRDDRPENDLTLENTTARGASGLRDIPVLMQTPWLFEVTMPWHFSYLDQLFADGLRAGGKRGDDSGTVGSWLPFFYNDKKRTFFVLPTPISLQKDAARQYYPDIKREFRKWNDLFEGWIRTWVSTINLGAYTPADRTAVEQFLGEQFPGERVPPFTDDQVRDLIARYVLRYAHYFLGLWSQLLFQFRQFHFKNFYHPFVCDFAKLVHDPLQGIAGLMKRETQLKDSGFKFQQSYQPTGWVVDPVKQEQYPREMVDFSPDGAYSPYNWEIFFHVPLLIANSLSKNQRFEEARDWYHFIFNPIGVESAVAGGSPMSKYWITKPFFETTEPQYVRQRIDSILRLLAGDTTAPGYSAEAKKVLGDQVFDWRTNPFEPHRIANYRTVAYQKTVFMRYLDNLIAWGDYLFRQDSMESINEATQLYILAAELLGPRPMKVPPRAKPPLESFNELEKKLDAFSNALVEVENLVPPLAGDGGSDGDAAPLPMLYFCIPQNDKMLSYWDTVADRLYKIRHCMNIEGVVRQLALFEPPIDPGALVKAVAGGADIGAALADLNAPLPLYRFSAMLQRANEICGDVRALGAALLTALEKRDAEALSQLRQAQEIRLLEAVKTVRQTQIDEAKETLAGLYKSKELTTVRRDYYQNIAKINGGEQLQQDKLEEALLAQQISQAINIAASIAHVVPTFDLGVAGFGGSPKAAIMFGGPNVGSALQAAAGGFTFWANVENYHANKASINAGHERRWDDWKLQERLANKELEQIDRQIAAAEQRLSIAEKELSNQLIQIENAKATDEFMRSKYTNLDLYQWQIGQISGVYFESYKLAQDLAKRAERCFRFELGLSDSSFISFGYWDSLKKGLLAGEKLVYDLRRMESAYVQQNRRELELTKHVSFAQLDPLALVKLRETGQCFIQLPEEIFDLDYPGHYFRRIKSVSLTLPCVAGPYTTISATLRLVKNSVRINTKNGDNGYPRNTDDQGGPRDDPRFVENNVPVKAIAASGAQNDSGMFELSFRDERYLPFEGAGAISTWSLELFNDLPANNPAPAKPDFGKPLRQFDYSSITDAVLHVKYTAREDSGSFKNGAVKHLREHYREDGATPSVLMADLRREFAAAWSRFQTPTNPANGNVLELDVSPDLFPLRDTGNTLVINAIWLLARCTDAGDYGATLTPPLPVPPPAGSNAMTLVRGNQYGGLHFGQKDVSAAGIEISPTDPPVTWKLRVTRPGGGDLIQDPATKGLEVKDLLLVLGYRRK